MTVGMGTELARDLERSLKELLPLRVVLELREAGQTSNHQLYMALLELGLLEVAIPESQGGLGLDVADLAELWFVAGRHLLPMAIRDQALVLLPLLTAASTDPRIASYIGRLRSGDARGGGRVFVGDPPEDGTVIAPCGADADLLFLLGPHRAVVYDEPAVVPLNRRDLGEGLVRFAVADRQPLLSFGSDVAHALWSQWNVAVMAEIAGCAARVLELSVAYAKERQQFGRAIAEFQAVSHMLADMRTELDASKAVIARVIAGLSGADDDDWLLSLGRYVVPSAARTVSELGIQVHGGTGFTWEYGLHLFYRRVLHLQTALGGADGAALMLGRLYLDHMRGEAGE